MHDDDAVAFLYIREPMRDDHRGPLFHNTFDGTLNDLFGFRVDRTRGFV